MAALTDQIVNSLKLICNCNFTTRYITSSRWVCDPTMPTRVIFEADVIGNNSGTFAVDIIRWADRTSTVDVGVGTPLALEGGEVSTMAPTTQPVTSTTSTTSSTQPPTATPTSFVWIIGIIAGVIVALILIAVIVVILLWWKRSNDTKNAKLVEGTSLYICYTSCHFFSHFGIEGIEKTTKCTTMSLVKQLSYVSWLLLASHETLAFMHYSNSDLHVHAKGWTHCTFTYHDF